MKSRISILLMLSAALVGNAAETAYKWEKPVQLGSGVSYTRCRLEKPRPIRITAVSVPLKNVALTMTGRCEGWGQSFGAPATEKSLQNPDGTPISPAAKRTKRESVTQFLRAMKAAPEKGGVKGRALFAFSGRGTDRPYFGDFADPQGLYIRDGEIVSDDRRKREGIFVVRRSGAASIETQLSNAEYGDVQFAISGKTRLREGGRCVVNPARKTPGPRLAIGLSANRETLYVVSADNGENPRYGEGGATYQDLDEIFADLGAADAIALDLGNSTAIVVDDPKGEGELQLNPFLCNHGDNCRNAVNIGVYSTGKKSVATPPAASAARKPEPEKTKGPEEIEAKIVKPMFSVVRDRKRNEVVMKGQVKVAISSELPRFKQPILNVCALFDVNGTWRFYDVMLTDQKVSHGFCAEHAKPYTPKDVSSWRTETAAAQWRTAVFGDTRSGFFHGYHVPADAKLVCWRVELWQNRGLVAGLDSDMKQAKKLGVPEDWYIKGKYTGKMSYYWTPPKEK